MRRFIGTKTPKTNSYSFSPVNVYKTVAVRLSTHDAGGKVTALDVELARRLEKVAGL
jgi:hypothetical protein